MLYTRKIKTYERGLRFVGGEFVAVLGPGRHTFVASPFNHRVDVVSVHGAWLHHPNLDVIAQKPELLDEIDLVEVADTERALVWIDGEFTHQVIKRPRYQGDTEEVSAAMEPFADDLRIADQALACVPDDLLYARVDVIDGEDGRPLVSELELIEPSLFLLQHPPALDRLIAAIGRHGG